MKRDPGPRRQRLPSGKTRINDTVFESNMRRSVAGAAAFKRDFKPNRLLLWALYAALLAGLCGGQAHSMPAYSPKLQSAARILRMPVRSPADQHLGEIENLIFDVSGTHLSYAVVSQGGVLGMGEERYLVPFHVFFFGEASDAATLRVTRQELEDAPRYREGEEVDLSKATVRDRIDAYYMDACPAYQAAYERYHRSADEPGQRSTPEEPRRRIQKYRMMTSFLGADVQSMKAEEIGSIHDVIVDLHSGRPVLVEVEYGGFAGMGSSMTVLPWSTITNVRSGEEVIYHGARDAFEAFSYEAADRPDFEDTAVLDRVFQVHDSAPYWVRFGYGDEP